MAVAVVLWRDHNGVATPWIAARRWIGDSHSRCMEGERDLNGTVVAGRYRVLTRIGAGGMGTVYAAEDTTSGRKVALKLLRRDASTSATLIERFRREARVTAGVEHENIVNGLDVGVTELGELFHVMEWLPGEDLHSLLRREKRVAWPRARAIVAQLCRALAVAHEAGVVHRDLKPGNLFLVEHAGRPDFLKVLDFGIAKLMAGDEANAQALTRIGEVIGTTPYMAPELAAGEAIDYRIDIYAAGVILFQLLSGRLPFRGRTPRQILVEILRGQPPRLVDRCPQLIVSPELEAVVRQAMHRDPDARYADMGALHEALLALPDDACTLNEALSDSDSAVVATDTAASIDMTPTTPSAPDPGPGSANDEDAEANVVTTWRPSANAAKASVVLGSVVGASATVNIGSGPARTVYMGSGRPRASTGGGAGPQTAPLGSSHDPQPISGSISDSASITASTGVAAVAQAPVQLPPSVTVVAPTGGTTLPGLAPRPPAPVTMPETPAPSAPGSVPVQPLGLAVTTQVEVDIRPRRRGKVLPLIVTLVLLAVLAVVAWFLWGR